MPTAQEEQPEKAEIVRMFSQSIAPYSKKLVALHPHLYGSLYHRASEIQALDKILQQLKAAIPEMKMQNYQKLPHILSTLKEALIGQPTLSWWNLFTASVGQAFSENVDVKKNLEEQTYLSAISEILTDVIRNYHSRNSKLLLDIRLTALEVDARLVELEKIPEGTQEVSETLDYLLSQFQLFLQELTKVLQMPKESWSNDSKIFLNFTEKAAQLLKIANNVEQTDYETFNKFQQRKQISELEEKVNMLLGDFKLHNGTSNQTPFLSYQLYGFFELFDYFPESLLYLEPKELYTFLDAFENWFIADPDLKKVRPTIFFSPALKKYVLAQSATCKERYETLRAMAKGTKNHPHISKNTSAYYKSCFIAENDLHHICSLIHSKDNGISLVSCNPTNIQKDILTRMISLANGAQPKDLDTVLKSFSDDEKENRYFLTQEVILEQFIRWRKMGIY